MKTSAIVAGAGIMLLGSMGLGQAQVSGTPNSPFPHAARHEIRTFNGVPCRTVLVAGTNRRVPVECAR